MVGRSFVLLPLLLPGCVEDGAPFLIWEFEARESAEQPDIMLLRAQVIDREVDPPACTWEVEGQRVLATNGNVPIEEYREFPLDPIEGDGGCGDAGLYYGASAADDGTVYSIYAWSNLDDLEYDWGTRLGLPSEFTIGHDYVDGIFHWDEPIVLFWDGDSLLDSVAIVIRGSCLGSEDIELEWIFTPGDPYQAVLPGGALRPASFTETCEVEFEMTHTHWHGERTRSLVLTGAP